MALQLAKPYRCVLLRLPSNLPLLQARFIAAGFGGIGRKRVSLEGAFADMHQLQLTYDEVLTKPWRFPAHVQRINELAKAERIRRQPIIDQTALDVGKNALFHARKIIYVIIQRNDSRVQLCGTRYTCGQDLLERSAYAMGKKRGPGRWLMYHGVANIILYPLESLYGSRASYHRLAKPRLAHWTKLLKDYREGVEAYGDRASDRSVLRSDVAMGGFDLAENVDGSHTDNQKQTTGPRRATGPTLLEARPPRK